MSTWVKSTKPDNQSRYSSYKHSEHFADLSFDKDHQSNHSSFSSNFVHTHLQNNGGQRRKLGGGLDVLDNTTTFIYDPAYPINSTHIRDSIIDPQKWNCRRHSQSNQYPYWRGNHSVTLCSQNCGILQWYYVIGFGRYVDCS